MCDSNWSRTNTISVPLSPIVRKNGATNSKLGNFVLMHLLREGCRALVHRQQIKVTFLVILFSYFQCLFSLKLTVVEVSEYAYDDHIPDDTKRFFGARRAPVISTGSLRLDQALGIGGLPKNSPNLSGLHVLHHLVFSIIRLKFTSLIGCCAYLDVENALCPSLAEAIGVNTDNLLISQPDSAENLLSMVDTLTKSGSVAVIVVDSVAALVPQCEVDELQYGSSGGLQSKIMTQALRKIHYSQCNSSTLIIFINQVRKNLKLVEGSVRADEVTCGGNALKFYAAIRMRISRKGLMKAGDKATGLGICVQVVKNKLAPSMAKAELGIRFGKGISRESEALDLACEHGVIVKDGNNYYIKGRILQSRDEVLRYLAANDGALDDIIRTLRSLYLLWTLSSLTIDDIVLV
ncbi:hypothetical protein DH2020_041543 [Rehmannia glutinosa]|uniref:RecA family profile 2 domain-containing protein n=1 Tax=Rehmannia glutinosa TaxID=99300 RepID=A0ABR0UR10_REHGL